VDAKVAVIVALQDATLQVAVQQVKTTPVVFHLLADPFAAGAGTSDSSHLANFTGVYSPGFGDPAQDRRVELIRRTVPNAKSIGVLFSSDEPLAVELKDKMKAAAQRVGLRVAEVGMASITDAPQAAASLVGQKVDAIEIYGNSVHTAFESVVSAAKAAKIPVFSASPFEVMKGATAAIYPDFQEGGTVAGGMVARILKGESPGSIPFYRVTTSKVSVNTSTGTPVPADVKNEANEVVGDNAKP
jgi:putative ABC transport system substrate-binding protein